MNFGFQGFPVFRRYSAFSASMHPIPLGALQNAAGGPFLAVLAVLRGLDVYAEGMSNGFVSFFWLNRLLDVFESAPVFDSYAQQVLRFRVFGL